MPLVRTCKSCGQKNRIPAKRAAESGRCGACKTPFPPVNEPLEVGPQTKMHSASGEMQFVPGEPRTSHFSQTPSSLSLSEQSRDHH
jgi:hypothetical protein